VVFALYLAISFLHPADSKIRGEGWNALLYVLQNFLLLPGLFPIEPIVTVAWSLSYEMFYYLAVPLTIALFQLRLRSLRWRVRFFLLLAAAIAIFCAIYGGHVRLIMFISGILLHEALRDGSLRVPDSATALLALVIGLVVTALPFAGPAAFTVRVMFLFGAFFIVCYTCFSKSDGWLAKGFSRTRLRWLGNMSYSYYLLHGLTLKVAFTVLAGKLPQVAHQTLFFIGLMPVMFFLTLLPAAGLFLLVERPLSLSPVPRRGAVPSESVVVDALAGQKFGG
jgi:peptidoglycan/LPS O-acetylase OafA/YrhL